MKEEPVFSLWPLGDSGGGGCYSVTIKHVILFIVGIIIIGILIAIGML